MVEASPTPAWGNYRACPVCKAPLGLPCMVRSGRIVDGRPDQVAVVSDRPHIARRLRSGRIVDDTPAPPGMQPNA